MIPTIKITCVAVIYYAIVSVCNFDDKITEITGELSHQVKEYVVDTCSAIVSTSAKVVFLSNSGIKECFPLKKYRLLWL